MLQSITLQYEAEQDRLVVRLIRREAGRSNELRLHLTRRICQQLAGQLKQMAEMSAQPPERLAQPARESVVSGHHEAMAARVPVHKAAPPDPPEVREALVLTVHAGRIRSSGHWILKFEMKDQAPVQLTLTEETLHGFIGLVDRKISQANWGLPPIVQSIAGSGAAAEDLLKNLH